jgi:alkylation response protein AidB-like acyl-CoA dehydrogenase
MPVGEVVRSPVASLTSPLVRLEPEQRLIVERIALLAREQFAPRAARYDAESIFPRENYDDLHAAGLLGLAVPKAYGGLGVDSLTYALSLLEMAKGCSATALTFNMHATVLGFLAELATPDQQRFYFRQVVEGGKLIASITSEPDQSFRDTFALQTRFVRQPDGAFHIVGVKQFCSLGDSADYYFVSGLVEGATSAREGMLSALVPRDRGGITVEGRWNATGMRGTASHTIRYDCVVDPFAIVGAPGQFLTVDLSGFALGYAAVYLGIGEAAYEFILDYARTRPRRPSNEPLAHDPLVQRTLAEMETALRSARLLLCEAALLKDTGRGPEVTRAVNQAKYLGAEVGSQVTERAIRLAGGRGILKDIPLERWRRDALAGPVMPPANDRCLETVGKILCGLRASTLEFQ